MADPVQWRPLTVALLEKRLAMMRAAIALHRPEVNPQEPALQHLDCNGCWRTLDTTAETPDGWVCRYDLGEGWLDLCDRCVSGIKEAAGVRDSA